MRALDVCMAFVNYRAHARARWTSPQVGKGAAADVIGVSWFGSGSIEPHWAREARWTTKQAKTTRNKNKKIKLVLAR